MDENKLTVKELRQLLFELADQDMTIKDFRYKLFTLPDDTKAILGVLMISEKQI